jgi:hypothetical protein
VGVADEVEHLAGLVDADAPDAGAQRELAAFLVGRGVPIEQLR